MKKQHCFALSILGCTLLSAEFVLAAPPNGGQVDPHEVKAVCEYACTSWLVFLSLCVITVCAWRHGIQKIGHAPKCCIGSAVGGLIFTVGFVQNHEWLMAVSGIIIVVCHACECSSITFNHLRSLLIDGRNDEMGGGVKLANGGEIAEADPHPQALHAGTVDPGLAGSLGEHAQDGGGACTPGFERVHDLPDAVRQGEEPFVEVATGG